MSGRVLAQLVNTVKGALQNEVDIVSTRLWLDSKTALCWINNQGEWKQFVRHRVNGILRLTEKEEWGHCPGQENPADLGSRGELASKLKCNNLWRKGPHWLSEPESSWRDSEQVVITPESEVERKKSDLGGVAQIEEVPTISSIVDIDRHSQLERLLRVTAWVKRFVFNLKAWGDARKADRLWWAEIEEAEQVWIKAIQAEMKGASNYSNLVRGFGLVEKEGIIRCVGRLCNSDLEFEAKQPILLPRESKLTSLTVEDCHKRVHHSGVRGTLVERRSRFLVPKGRQVVKKILGRCVVCKRVQGKAYSTPPTAALPEFRVREMPPFSKVGVDFAGPLYVKVGQGIMEKAYIALFTCCVTRAIHLDLLYDLSAPTFLCCLRRFVARRGAPSLVVSDNAKTFKATKRALAKLYDDPEVKAHLDGNRIEWKFNLERAPWWGAFFERMIGTVKRCLKKVLGNAKLSFVEMETILIELEGTLNSRPWTYEYDEVGAEMLTPSHLVFGRRLADMPDNLRDDEKEEQIGPMRRFRYLARKRVHFWNTWQREYLVDLREQHRQKAGGRERTVEIGDVVLVHGENEKRGMWKVGKVEEKIVGRDGIVRCARVKVITKGKPVYIGRPVQKLYLLEIRSAEKEEKERTEQVERVEPVQIRRTNRRAAAMDARWKTKAMLGQ